MSCTCCPSILTRQRRCAASLLYHAVALQFSCHSQQRLLSFCPSLSLLAVYAGAAQWFYADEVCRLAYGCMQVMVFVASCPLNPGRAQDLTTAPRLEAVITYTEADNHRALTQHVTEDLAPFATAAAASGEAQSLIVAVAYLDQPGWTIRMDLTGSKLASWGLMLPDLQAAIVRVRDQAGVDLDAARALAEAPPSDTAVVRMGAWGAGPHGRERGVPAWGM